MGRDYSDDLRAELAEKGEAMPDGSYPTPDESALEDAFRAYGRETGNKPALRRYLVRRAIALGRTDLIPDTWHVEARSNGNTTDGHEDDSTSGSRSAA